MYVSLIAKIPCALQFALPSPSASLIVLIFVLGEGWLFHRHVGLVICGLAYTSSCWLYFANKRSCSITTHATQKKKKKKKGSCLRPPTRATSYWLNQQTRPFFVFAQPAGLPTAFVITYPQRCIRSWSVTVGCTNGRFIPHPAQF